MSSRLQLLQVVPYYSPAWGFGGPPRVMLEEARELTARGHQVRVFTTDVYDSRRRVPGPAKVVEDGIAIQRFRNISNRLAHDHTRFTPIGLRKALTDVVCDVVHLSEVRHELAILTWGAAKRRGLPLVVSAYGTLPGGEGRKSRIKVVYDSRYVGPMLRAATALLAQTQHEANCYRDFGTAEERIHILPLGTSPPPSGDPLDLGVEPDRRVVLFLGRLHPLKGIHRLLTAFHAVAHRHRDVVLVIAGRDDGSETDLRRQADSLSLGDRVRFAGGIYGDDRFSAYRRADLFAMTPTQFEETSLAAIEAASVGTPLLLGDEAEAPYLDEYAAGWRVAPGCDVAPVLDAALNGDLRLAGQGARRMVQDRHLWSVVGAQLEGILLEATT